MHVTEQGDQRHVVRACAGRTDQASHHLHRLLGASYQHPKELWMMRMPSTCKVVMMRFVIVNVTWCIFPNIQQDYGFDYSDGEGADDAVSVDVENMYYTAKCLYLVLFAALVPLIQKS
jgi:hypothetical protein